MRIPPTSSVLSKPLQPNSEPRQWHSIQKRTTFWLIHPISRRQPPLRSNPIPSQEQNLGPSVCSFTAVELDTPNYFEDLISNSSRERPSIAIALVRAISPLMLTVTKFSMLATF